MKSSTPYALEGGAASLTCMLHLFWAFVWPGLLPSNEIIGSNRISHAWDGSSTTCSFDKRNNRYRTTLPRLLY